MVEVEIHPLKVGQLISADSILLPHKIADQVVRKIGRKEFTVIKINSTQSYVLEAKRADEEVVRIGFTLRSLISCAAHAKVELSKPDESLCAVDSQLKSLLHRIWRRVDSWQEDILAAGLGAPTSIFRTTQTYAGDDDRFLVRIHPSLFPRLGIAPGDHVFVERMGRKIVAIAFEEQLEGEFHKSHHLEKSQIVGLNTKEIAEDFPRYLIIRVSPQAREALGIPKDDADSIVSVRRRVRTRIVSEFNKMVLPVAVLLIGVIPSGISAVWKFIICFIVTPLIIAIGLAPLKIRRTPKGLWL